MHCSTQRSVFFFALGYTQPLERLERRDLDSRREAQGPVEMRQVLP